MKVVIIGGGPAGMIAGIKAAEEGNKVYIYEKNNMLGKKLLITGKGRCNITSSLDINDFIKNIPGNGKFLFSAFQNYTNIDIINLLEKNGVKVKEERGNRIFPVSDKSQDVLNALIKELKKNNVQIRECEEVNRIIVKDGIVKGIELKKDKRIIEADKVILATGGKSYPGTGSTGDGYKMAENLGHTVTKIQGSLVPLEADLNICSELQGLSLRNVKIVL